MSTTATVRVPASTSNLGAGFDCVGVAVSRWLTVTASLEGRTVDIERAGTLTTLGDGPEEDRLTAGFLAACEAAAVARPSGVRMWATSEIPIACGLGSSAAALVAGAALANVLLDLGLPDEEIVDACTLIEGHPDNVVPCVRGGATLALRTAETTMPGGPRIPRGGILATPLTVHDSLALVLAVPDFTLSTAQARLALPPQVTHATAATAVARSAALICGLASGDGRLLRAALDDLLHVPYRRPLIQGYDAVATAALDAGAFGATLSGAGSAIVAISDRRTERDVANAMVDAWAASGVRAESLVEHLRTPGYHVVGGEPDVPTRHPSAPTPPDHTLVRRKPPP